MNAGKPQAAFAPARPVSVHIDRLVLDGAVLGGQALGARASAVLQSALQTELAALIARGGPGAVMLAGGALPHLRAGDMATGATPGRARDPAQLGQALARALHEAMQR